mgnify:FL=1
MSKKAKSFLENIMKKYILENSNDAKRDFKEHKLFDKSVYVINPLSDGVSLEAVLNHIEEKLPPSLTANFENIYIGAFDEFSENGRDVNALYKDGTIYVSNIQDSESDMIDDIVHEIAHSLEERNYEEIYGDDQLENEFLGKRKFLHHILPDDKRANMVYFLNPSYDQNFDMYLYKELGYDMLRTLTSDLFYSPYAITALKEYWANGFENYFLQDRAKLRSLSPVLYQKIKNLVDSKKEERNGL